MLPRSCYLLDLSKGLSVTYIDHTTNEQFIRCKQPISLLFNQALVCEVTSYYLIGIYLDINENIFNANLFLTI